MNVPNKQLRTFTSISIKSLTTIIINKLFAVLLGTAGIALLAHFQNLISILIHLSQEGINRGLAKLIYHNKLKPDKLHQYLNTGLVLNVVFFLLSVFIILIFDDFFLQYLPQEISDRLFLKVFFVAAFIFLLNLFFVALLMGLKRIKYYVLIHLTGAFFLIAACLWGVNQNLDLALLAYSIGQAGNLVVIVYAVLRSGKWRFKSVNVSRKASTKLLNFLLMALSVLVFSKLVDFFVRDFALDVYGLNVTGMWQAVVKFSDSYMNVFIATVGAVYYPQVTELVFDTDQLRKYLKDVLYLVVPITLAGLGLAFVFRAYVIRIFFSEEFLHATHLFKFHLLGDFFCIISYLLTFIISAQARTSLFIGLQAGSAIFYVVLVFFLTSIKGIEGIPMAHAIRFIVFFIILMILNRRLLFK